MSVIDYKKSYARVFETGWINRFMRISRSPPDDNSSMLLRWLLSRLKEYFISTVRGSCQSFSSISRTFDLIPVYEKTNLLCLPVLRASALRLLPGYGRAENCACGQKLLAHIRHTKKLKESQVLLHCSGRQNFGQIYLKCWRWKYFLAQAKLAAA